MIIYQPTVQYKGFEKSHSCWFDNKKDAEEALDKLYNECINELISEHFEYDAPDIIENMNY